MYVDAELRKLPRLLIVIVDDVEVAVNLYQTAYVVVIVAPPQEPAGATLTAFCKFPVVVVQEVPGVKPGAVAQVACE